MFVKEAKRSGTIGVVFSPEGSEGSFATCGCEAQIESLTHLDDGRLIVECTGTRRFHVEGIRQAEPYVKAHVKFDEDDGGAAEEDLIASCEVDCWKTLQEVIWLCVEVWDKRQVSLALKLGHHGTDQLAVYRLQSGYLHLQIPCL
jgi:Lon protease-like protein